MNRRAFITATATLAVPLGAGCTGTEQPEASPTETRTASPTPTETPTSTGTMTETPPSTETTTATATPQSAQERFPDYDWDKLDGVDAAATSTITMQNFAFQPLVATVESGTELTIANQDSSGHTFTVPSLGIDERIEGNSQVSVTIERTGTFDYVCELHPPGMLGRLVVTATQAGATPTQTATEAPTQTTTATATVTETPTQTRTDGGGGSY